MGCKSLFKIFSLLTTLIVSFIVFVVIFKPNFVLDPIKEFLNNPYPVVLELHADSRVDMQQLIAENSGSLVLTEDQFYNLVNDKFPHAGISRVELEEDRIILFKNIAQKGKPLWMIAEIEIEEQKYKIGDIGLGRFKVPNAFKESVVEWMKTKVEGIKTEGKETKFELSALLGQEMGMLLDPKNIVLKENELEVKLVNIDSSKFNEIFQNFDPSKYNQDLQNTIKGVTDSIKNLQEK